MDLVVNPQLIKRLRHHYINAETLTYASGTKTPLHQISDDFGLDYSGTSVGITMSGKRETLLSGKNGNPEHEYQKTLRRIRDHADTEDQDAFNLYFEVIHDPRNISAKAFGNTRHSTANKAKYKRIFRDLPTPKLHDLFERLYQYGLLDLFEQNLDKKGQDEVVSFLPRDFAKKLEIWKNLPRNKSKFDGSQQSPAEMIDATPVEIKKTGLAGALSGVLGKLGLGSKKVDNSNELSLDLIDGLKKIDKLDETTGHRRSDSLNKICNKFLLHFPGASSLFSVAFGKKSHVNTFEDAVQIKHQEVFSVDSNTNQDAINLYYNLIMNTRSSDLLKEQEHLERGISLSNQMTSQNRQVVNNKDLLRSVFHDRIPRKFLDSLFERLKKYGLLEMFEERVLGERDIVFPENVANKLELWKKDNSPDIEEDLPEEITVLPIDDEIETPTIEIDPDKAEPDDTPKPPIDEPENLGGNYGSFPNEPTLPDWMPVEKVDVTFEKGSGDEMLPLPLGGRFVGKDPTDPPDREFREVKVAEILAEIGINREYYRGGWRSDDDKFVFHLYTPQGGDSVLLIRDYNEIYVYKPKEFHRTQLPLWISPHEKMKTLSLRDLPDDDTPYLVDKDNAWKTSLNNAPKDLALWLFTRAEALKVQPKHRVAWANKGPLLQHSFIASLIATGHILKTGNARPIVHGNLAGVDGATSRKAYQRLRDEAMKYFARDGIKTFAGIRIKVFDEIPLLPTFENAQPFNGLELFRAVASNIIAKRPVADMSAAFGGVKDRSPEQLSVAIAYSGIPSINRALDPKWSRPLRSFGDFIEASGLGVSVDDDIMTVEPNEAQQLLQMVERRFEM